MAAESEVAAALTMDRRTMVTAFAASGLMSACERGSRPVIVGQVNLGFYTATAAVILKVLTRLDHRVTTIEAPHTEIYAALGRGSVDMLVAAWLPHAHGALHAPYAGELFEPATLYRDALLYWSVPAYIPAKSLRTIDDLKRPEVLSRVERNIIAVGPGSGLARGSEEMLDRYDLRRHGYSVTVASPAVWSQQLDRARAEGKWIVMPLWRPHYLNRMHDLRVLLERKGVFRPDDAKLVVRRAVWSSLPERSRQVLSRVHLGIAAATDLDVSVERDGLDPPAAADEWFGRNRSIVESWFAR